jgi:hypothetical protein
MKFSEYSLPILAMRLVPSPRTGCLKIALSVDRNSISLRHNLKKVGGDGIDNLPMGDDRRFLQIGRTSSGGCFSMERNDSHNLPFIGINEKTGVLSHFYKPAWTSTGRTQ